MMAIIKRNLTSLIYRYISPEKFKVNIKFPQLPERFKGTIVEKWAEYWKNLSHDYAEVFRDTAISAKNHPIKTTALFTLFGVGIYCNKNNPDEMSYRNAVISATEELMFVGPLIRNPKPVEYLKEIEKSHNEETLHRLSLGLFSVIWKDDYNECVGLYKAHCEYLGVPYFKFYERILDIGFLNRWFILENIMEDYDINPEEWKHLEDSTSK